METISDYTIYCTPEQTKKARELGAPIEVKTIEEAPKDWQGKAYFTGMATCAKLPTAEQMISWLEENNIETIIVCKKDGGDYGYTVYHTSHRSPLQHFWFSSRKEATLAAIDAALEYLSNNK